MSRLLALVCFALVVLPAAGAAAPPGNGKLAFIRTDDVWIANADGSDERELTGGSTYESGPLRWSPDGTRIAFVSTLSHPPRGEPHVIAADGNDVVLLAGRDDRFFSPACWLTNELVVLTGVPAVGEQARDLYVVAADGTGLRRLTTDADVTAPVCSPDGETIFFIRAGVNYAVGIQGGEPVRITPAGGQESSVSVSPDGRRVAVIASRPSRGVFVRNVDGSGNAKLFDVHAVGIPLWSPDGSKLLLTVLHEVGFARYGPVFAYDLRTFALDGSEERVLTPRDVAYSGGWSPDGMKILFGTGRRGKAETYVMNADGTCETPLLETPEWGLAWQPVPGAPPSAPFRCVDIGITASPVTEPVALWQRVMFSFTIRNDGNESADHVRVEIPLLAVFDSVAVSSGGPCEIHHSGARVVCTLTRLASGETEKVEVQARATRPGTFVTSATARAWEREKNYADNQVRLDVTVLPCRIVGSASRDVLEGTGGNDSICARAGDDEISSRGGSDFIDAGSGNDLVSLGIGRDRVAAGSGFDFVRARDGERDTVRCGSDRDVVVADLVDRVARDCEHVVRRRK